MSNTEEVLRIIREQVYEGGKAWVIENSIEYMLKDYEQVLRENRHQVFNAETMARDYITIAALMTRSDYEARKKSYTLPQKIRNSFWLILDWMCVSAFERVAEKLNQ